MQSRKQSIHLCWKSPRSFEIIYHCINSELSYTSLRVLFKPKKSAYYIFSAMPLKVIVRLSS